MKDSAPDPLVPNNSLRKKLLAVGILLVALIVISPLLQRQISQDEITPPTPVLVIPRVSPTNTSTIGTLSPTPFYIPELIDPLGFVRVSVPQGWMITSQDEYRTSTFNRSIVTLESPDWKIRDDNTADGPCTPFYYENGASFVIDIITNNETGAHGGEGGNIQPDVEKQTTIDGREAVYHEYQEFCAVEGRTIDAHVNYNGVGYTFALNYSPERFPRAPEVFWSIINSIKFLR